MDYIPELPKFLNPLDYGDAIQKHSANLEVLTLRFNKQKDTFQQIKAMIELREELEERITSVLSDYTQMINQVSLVATLTLGMALNAFGSLLGNTDDQPEWKVALFTISCVTTTLFSIMSVLESFFLSIHINQVEARFASGTFPHIGNYVQGRPRREFNIQDLVHLNATFNFIVMTFFVAFLSFSTTMLGTVYMGMGISNSVFESDTRLVEKPSTFPGAFPNQTAVPLDKVEPNFMIITSTLTTIVIIAYTIITYRFLTVYVRYIHARSLINFLLIFGCQKPDYESQNFKEPIRVAANKFNNLQRDIFVKIGSWQRDVVIFMASVLEIRLGKIDFVKQHENNQSRKKAAATAHRQMERAPYQKIIDSAGSIWGWCEDVKKYCSDAIIDLQETYSSNRELSIVNMIKVETCSYHTSSVMCDVELIQKFRQSEWVEPPVQYIYEMHPCAALLAIVVVLWGISGGIIITLIRFLIGILISFTINGCCRCVCQDERVQKIDSIRKFNITEFTMRHYKYLSELVSNSNTRREAARSAAYPGADRREYIYKKLQF